MSTLTSRAFALPPPGRPHLVRLLAQALHALVRWAACHWRTPIPESPRTRGDEARAVREWARQWATIDPRFATDLCAAADRHEQDEA